MIGDLTNYENMCIFYFHYFIRYIIIDKKLALFPIEVKYRNVVNRLDAINLFSKKFKNNKIEKALIITKNELKKNDEMYFIPYWLLK